MAQLIYEIQGTSAGLAKAVNESISLLQHLQLEVNKLSNGAGFTGLGSAIQVANNQALQLNKTLSDTSLSAQDKGGIAALDTLGRKLLTIKGNTELFGDSLRNQQAELGAYQSALNKLLSLGFQPLDGDVTRIKANIDSLTASIAAASAVPVKRVEISNSLAEATAFNVSSTSSGPVASSGTAALIAEFDKDLAAGKITAAEYRAEIDRINASQANFARSTSVSSAALETEVGILEGLKAELRSLQTAKVSLVNPTDIAKQNALIQELEAEITRFNNVGKVGFDSSGVAIKNFGKEAEKASSGGLAGFGKGLTGALSGVRQLAYILPGIGMAGIFNLAFEAIAAAAAELDIFSKKISQAENNLNALNAVNKDAAQSIGQQTAPLKELYDATQNVSLAIGKRIEAAQQLRELYPAEFQNATNLAIVNGDLKKSYDELTDSIIKNAVSTASQTQIGKEAANAAEATLQIAKIKVAEFNETQKAIKNFVSAVEFENKRFGKIVSPAIVFEQANDPKQNTALGTIKIQADNAISGQNSIINRSKTTINFLEGFVKNVTDSSNKLDAANKLLGDQLQNFDNLIATGNSRATLENIKNALQTKLNSLAPSDPQISSIRDKIRQVEEIIKNAYDVKTTKGVKSPFLDLNKQIDDLLAKTNNLAQASGLTGYALSVEKITATYIDLNRQVDQFNKKVRQDVRTGRITQAQGAQLLAKSANVTSVLPGNEDKELNDAKIAEAQRIATEIDRINNEFGVKAEQTRGREIAQVEALADKEIDVATKGVFTRTQIEQNYQNAIVKAKGNDRLIQQAELLRTAEINAAQNASDEVVAIQNGKITAIRAINDKYLQIEQDLWDRISIIDDQSQSEIGNKTQVETGKINKEWESRREAANKYYQQLQIIAKSQTSGFGAIAPFNLPGFVKNAISGKQDQTNTGIDKAKQADINLANNRDLLQGLQSATSGFLSDFQSGLSSIGDAFTKNNEISAQIKSLREYQKTLTDPTDILENQKKIAELQAQLISTSFKSVFAGIADSFAKTMNNVAFASVSKVLANKLEQGIKDGTLHLSGALQGAIAAAGIAGGIISSVTPKTSIVGQGLGGALSGAASGALIGSVIPGVGTVAGAIIGGGIGLLGGIFGASKAQKELQAQQLAEQKQQTALLKASLAYTSTIIGRMTSQGVVTGVDVGAFGQLTATVSGKDLQFVLDRNNNGR